ncbi:selenium metabolism-associated LysR family transcriptional regulator [Salinibacillus xinjiangensis]|uniref:LysR family transcriptional regulator n=1 Tax=Salinibacillus xinjiangensis TaxID=1229268 RepID=A0A6G1X1Z4_9BACI|nr:selenium metabolism-associated LysR family transcriptional regulator [Salinibacillus xinjiangensis]MRG85003.1 LysR family transcriptional regulator [Salinibacillus xinjiangensis]
MNFEHLKVFYTAANKKNFSETAKILHLSQPSVSSQIRQLEESLNVSLFRRTTKKVSLTAEGKLLYQYAGKILELVNQTKKEIDLLSQSVHGELIIGASLTTGEYFLPYFLGQYKQEYPHVDLTMKIYNSEQIIEKLENEEINVGFIESMISYSHLHQEAIMDDELVMVASKQWFDSSFDEEETITPEELFSLPIIMREQGSGTRQVVEENLRRNDLNPSKLNIILELESTESIKSAVESGMGISIISKSAVQKEMKLGILKALRIKGIRLKRYFYAVYNDQNLSLPSESFVSFIKENTK